MSAPIVHIIVLNWNGLTDSLACLESLSKVTYERFQVVVVDNGSSDQSAETIASQFPDVKLIQLPENRGFVGGNNVGMQYAVEHKTDYLLLLNNDTEVAPDFLDKLVATAEKDQVGIVGPAIYYHAQPDVLWSAGGWIDANRGNAFMYGFNHAGSDNLVQKEVDFVTGCALLIKREVVEKVGGLDERFFAYYEEIEWCVRVRRAGYKVVFEPESLVWHKITVENRQQSPLTHYYMTRNRLLFLKAIDAGWRGWSNTLIRDYLRTLTSWTIRPKWWRSRRQLRPVMVRAIWDYARGNFGKAAFL